MKRILNIVLKSALGVGIVSLFIFANQKQKQTICPDFIIEMKDEGIPLVSRYYIRQLVTENEIKVKGQPLGDINLEKIQNVIAGSPFVKSVNLTIDVNGKVKASVQQRNPIVRVIDKTGNQYYLDSDGKRVPISHEFPARVLVANGKIEPVSGKAELPKKGTTDQPYKLLSGDLQKVFLVTQQLGNEPFLNALVEQVYINPQGEIELIPKIGDQSILLGDTVNLKEKLEKLKIFYTMENRTEQWAAYRLINLKYHDQIICKKTN